MFYVNLINMNPKTATFNSEIWLCKNSNLSYCLLVDTFIQTLQKC